MTTPVNETFPSMGLSLTQKANAIAVPPTEISNWNNATYANEIAGAVQAMTRATQYHSLLPGRAPATVSILDEVVRLIGTISDAIPDVGKDFTVNSTIDLNKVWALMVEKYEQGGDLDGTASGNAMFGVPNGIISGTFVTNVLYDLSSDGSLFTYAGGKFGPIAIGLASNYAFFDASRRVFADNSTIDHTASGGLQFKDGASIRVNNLEIDGQLNHDGLSAAFFGVTLAGRQGGDVGAGLVNLGLFSNASPTKHDFGGLRLSGASSALAVSTAFVTVTNWNVTDGLSNGISISSGGILVALKAQTHYMNWSVSFNGTANRDYKGEVHKNGSPVGGRAARTIASGGGSDIGDMTGGGLYLNLAVNDQITVKMLADAAATMTLREGFFRMEGKG